MATNEIYRDANHLSLPVDTGTVSGDPVLIGGVGGLCGVAQTTEGENYGTTEPYTPTTWGTVPGSTGFNEAGYASIALVGAFAFDIDGGTDLSVGDVVNIDNDGGTDGRAALVTSGGDAAFGHVINWTSGGRTVVRIANPATAA